MIRVKVAGWFLLEELLSRFVEEEHPEEKNSSKGNDNCIDSWAHIGQAFKCDALAHTNTATEVVGWVGGLHPHAEWVHQAWG